MQRELCGESGLRPQWSCHLTEVPPNIAALFSQARAAGFGHCEIGSRLLLAEQPSPGGWTELRSQWGIDVSAAFEFGHFAHWSRRREVYLHHDRLGRLLQRLGIGAVILSPGIRLSRVAGPDYYANLLRMIGEIHKRYSHCGVKVSIHPHFAHCLFTAEEIDYVFERIAADIGLVPDIEHLIEAGIEPRALLANYRGRIPAVHLKNVVPLPPSARGQERSRPSRTVAGSVFAEGLLDVAGLAAWLASWKDAVRLTVEMETGAQAAACLRYAEAYGGGPERLAEPIDLRREGEFRMLTTERFLETLAGRDGPALWHRSSRSVGYRELADAAAFNRRALERLGARRAADGGQQAIIADIGLGWRLIPVLLAALAIGVTVVPADSRRQPQQAAAIAARLPQSLRLEAAHVDGGGRINAEALPPFDWPPVPELADTAFVLFTSGTTGHPKGVMLTYANIWSNVEAMTSVSWFQSSDRLLIVRPLTTASALTGELLAGLAAGCTVHLKDPEAPVTSLLPLAETMTATVIGLPPTVAAWLAPQAARRKLGGLRRLIVSGECLTAAQYELIRRHLPGAALWNAYGLTEASPRISVLPDIPSASDSLCVGPPLPGVRVRVVDAAGHDRAEGEYGELLVAGPNVMKGYLGEPGLTEIKLRGGWLRTGDEAAIRAGRIYLRGRKDHMLIRSGVNVYPEEIEAALMRHPGVHGALAFARRDPERGTTQIHAWIEGGPDLREADVHRFLLESGIDQRLRPDLIVKRAQLPRTGSGKLLRHL